MAEYDNTNRGTLFVNDRKEKDSHPDRKGSINIEGKEYWISGWIKEIQNGKRTGEKMLSLSVTPKEEEEDAPKPKSKKKATPAEMDGDIPF